MPRFRVTKSHLEGASYKDYDWGPGTSQPNQPMGRATDWVREIEASDESEALRKLGEAPGEGISVVKIG